MSRSFHEVNDFGGDYTVEDKCPQLIRLREQFKLAPVVILHEKPNGGVLSSNSQYSISHATRFLERTFGFAFG